MSALSTEAILRRLEEDDLSKKLIISPLLDPAVQAKPGHASVDLRLGFEFCLVVASKFGTVSELDTVEQRQSFASLYRREYVPFGGSLVVHPHQFVLAQTFEYIRLPPDLMAYVVGRSTWGRLGLIVATAIGVHPGFSGNLTLELRNLGETPLTLYPGQTIAQLFLHLVVNSEGDNSTEQAPGAQYVGAVDMIPKKLSDPATFGKLQKLKAQFEGRP